MAFMLISRLGKMTRLTASWRKLTSSPILERSSQTVSVVGDKVYIFGGELKPRKPRDADTHIIDLKNGTISQAKTSLLPSASNSPPARVGSASTTVQEKIYIFSGRGGPAMTCLEENGSFWVFDPTLSNWSLLSPTDPSLPHPVARSYHSLTSDTQSTIYLHAGCPAQGRLSDLWSFDIPTKTWTSLPPAPAPARGGTSLAFSAGHLYRMNGFDGTTEQGGSLDTFTIATNSWSTISFPPNGIAGPEPRSVSCLLAIEINGKPSLVTMLGERDPSSLGHAGAGKMLSDVWVFGFEEGRWIEVGEGVEDGGGEKPVARGWFGADVVRGGGGKEGIVLQGGLDGSNARLGDVWVLEIN